MASLESRIEKLQARLAVLDRSLPPGSGGGASNGDAGSSGSGGNGGGAGAGDATGGRGGPGGGQAAKVGGRKRADDSEIEDLVADLGYLWAPLPPPLPPLAPSTTDPATAGLSTPSRATSTASRRTCRSGASRCAPPPSGGRCRPSRARSCRRATQLRG